MHLGRVLAGLLDGALPNERGLWPDFHSPLMWDFLAISTYLAGKHHVFVPAAHP